MSLLPAALPLALCLALGGCAGGVALTDDAPGAVQAGRISPPAASQAVAPGRSTRADVSNALGKANVIRFDSGYEVWVYRWAGADRTPRTTTEFVILFEPSGIVRKTRIRPGYAPDPK